MRAQIVGRSWDRLIALLLFAATFTLLASLPRNLSAADESYYLYESARIRDGQLLYRDIFQFITPLASYAMAAAFWAFGTSMATARIAMALLHASIAVILYATCRALGVRRDVAVLAPLAHVAIGQPAWQIASPHWVATFLASLLLFTLVAGPWPSRPRWASVPGLVTGTLIGVQQQKGAVMAAGVCVLFILDHLVGRRYPAPETPRVLGTRLACFAAGMLLMVVVVLGPFVMLVGPATLYESLVRYPLVEYRREFSSRWGGVGPLIGNLTDFTLPGVLRWSPLAAAALVVPASIDLVSGTGRFELRAISVLLVSAASSVLSIWYYPDYIHIAFILPAFLACLAFAFEITLRRVGPASPAIARAGGVVATLLAAALVVQVARTVELTRRTYPTSHDTRFGRVAFASRWEPALVDVLRRLLDEAPSRSLFCYPNVSSFYLTAAGDNPTPYQYFSATKSPAVHTREVLSILRTRRVPYVVLSPFLIPPGDPVAAFVRENYEPVKLPEIDALGELPAYWLFARKDRDRPAT